MELGKAIPVLEPVEGDGDCLYAAVAQYLNNWGLGLVTAAGMRHVVSGALINAEPMFMKYVRWGILSDMYNKSPAHLVEAYAAALLQPKVVYGGQLELHIISEQLVFRYHIFHVPNGNTVHNEESLPAEVAVEGPSFYCITPAGSILISSF